MRDNPFRREYSSLLLKHLYSSFILCLACLAPGSKVPASGFLMSVSSQPSDWQETMSLLHSRLFPFQFYITWENKHDKIRFHQDKTEEWQTSLTTSLHCTAHVIDCRMYFTLHCIQRVHLLQSGVIYKPYGLTVSFCRQQIQSALMQKHVLSLRERQIQTSEQENMIISHKSTEMELFYFCNTKWNLSVFK